MKVGTRGSALALAQTTMVMRMLGEAHPDLAFVSQVISSEGDRDKSSPLAQIGGRGVFTSALQERLLDGEIRRLRAFENLVHVNGGTSELLSIAGSI